MKTKKGFTLVELAIALVVIGLISGIGVTAIITALAENKRISNVEKNLEMTSKGVIGLIQDNSSRGLPQQELVDNLTASDLRENYKFLWDRGVTTGICQVRNTQCRVAVCSDATCVGAGVQKTINNVLFAMVETGPNKTYDSLYPVAGVGADTSCNVKIDKYNKNNDDKIIFYTLAEAKALAGCDDLIPKLEIVNDFFPPFFKDKAPSDDSIKLQVTTIPNMNDYKFCVSNPLGHTIVQSPGEFNWIRNNSVSIPDMDCDGFGYIAGLFSSSDRPYLVLRSGNTTNLFNSPTMLPGTYLFNFKVGYGTFPNGATIAQKYIVLSLYN